MSRSSRRTLVQALIVSMLIHAAIMLRVVTLSPVKQGASAVALDVVVKREEPRVAPAVPAQPVSVPDVKPTATPVKPRTSPVRTAPTPPTLTSDRAVDTFAVPVPALPPAQDVVASAASPAETAGGTIGAVSKQGVAASDGISANDVSDLRVSVITATRRFKNYPRLAKERGWEGTVEVALVYSAHLPYPDVSVARSSGRTILDEQALDMVGRAARATALPAGLRVRDFRVSLPVKFSLEDDQ